MRRLASFFNRSLLIYAPIFAILHFSTNVDIIQKQRLVYLRVCVHDNYGRINDRTNVIFLDYLTLLNPGHAPSWVRLGVSQFNLGELDNAIASYKKAIALDPNTPKYQEDLFKIELIQKSRKDKK